MATTTTVVVTEKEPNCCRAAIPALHIGGAVTACIFNIFIPGFGTVLAGFFVFCCGNPGQPVAGKVGTCCLNFWIGLLQLVLSPIFFIGWIWSWIWACAFIAMSADYHNNKTETTVITTSAAPAQPTVVYIEHDANAGDDASSRSATTTASIQ
uniref:Protein SPEC3-like n=1 Tax=Saccoglossus kowalevskii TaxID=10224 RepID=A0ABM0GRH5_SACKO|nr:PREDICTED: protein SPEC3-like [Saccoglossus kowalevskii]